MPATGAAEGLVTADFSASIGAGTDFADSTFFSLDDARSFSASAPSSRCRALACPSRAASAWAPPDRSSGLLDGLSLSASVGDAAGAGAAGTVAGADSARSLLSSPRTDGALLSLGSTANHRATAAAAAIAGPSNMSHLRIGEAVPDAGTGVVRAMTASIAWQRAHFDACDSAEDRSAPSSRPSDHAASVSASRQSSVGVAPAGVLRSHCATDWSRSRSDISGLLLTFH